MANVGWWLTCGGEGGLLERIDLVFLTKRCVGTCGGKRVTVAIRVI